MANYRFMGMDDANGGRNAVFQAPEVDRAPVQPSYQEDKFDQVFRRRANGSRDTGVQRQLAQMDRLKMMDVERMDGINKANADRGQAATLEALKGFTMMQGADAGRMGQEKAAEFAAAGMDRKERNSVYDAGIAQGGRLRDDARSDRNTDINERNTALSEGHMDRSVQWDDELRRRADEDVQRGQQSQTPFETWTDPNSGQNYYRSWGDMDPKSGAPSGWRPVQQSGIASLFGASGAGAADRKADGRTQVPDVGGNGSVPMNPLRRKTKDGRIALFDPETKAFMKYE